MGITDSYDVAQKLYGTVRVFQGHLYRYGYQNLHVALATYSAVSGAVRAYGGVPPFGETQWYVYNVSALYTRYRRTQIAGADRLACRPGGC
ncbi:MAG: lytic transglycosylase domain-containing protein [Armatimonadetes bacterium]|nr:lytic transglycosylase domain-containing protein [Armatimonadota bacterium]